MTIPATCMAAVFEGPRQPMALKEFKRPQSLPDGAARGCSLRYHENLSKFMLKRTVTQHTQLRG